MQIKYYFKNKLVLMESLELLITHEIGILLEGAGTAKSIFELEAISLSPPSFILAGA